jgi:endonuclease/exonuclease/phosphatase family metal-dependent hydrolase
MLRCSLVALCLIASPLTACSSADECTCPGSTACTSPDAGVDAVDVDHASPDVEAKPDGANGEPSPEAATDAGTEEASPPDGFRIMTFNIKHGDVSSLEAIADVIRAEAPDVVGLQEVDVDADRSDNVDQPHRLSQLTGMASLFRSSLTFSGGGDYGLALLSRFPILTSSKLELTSSGEQRILVIVDVLTEHGTIPVAVTHLGLTSAERVVQVDEILAELGNRTNVILMGDMNAQPDSPEMEALAGLLSDAWEAGSGDGSTIPVDAPTRRIDYIFLGSAWPTPTQAHVPATTASDHLPVVAFVPWP